MRKAQRYTPQTYAKALLNGNRVMLAKAITLVESRLEQDQKLAQAVIADCMPYTAKSVRIGITGVPGVGKSTFIETFGLTLVEKYQKKVAVLAVDPSSGVSGGSILGDKTRMQRLSVHPQAFIRPSPNSGNLGGVARNTREAMLLCEAAGFDVILVETVGVGQSETIVSEMTDFFLLLMLPNAGDELQGIKKGVMEKADMLLINKADGEFLPKARAAKVLYSQAMRLFPAKDSAWKPLIHLCSALEENGISEVWEAIMQYEKTTRENGFWQQNRNQQAVAWMKDSVNQRLLDLFYSQEVIGQSYEQLREEVAAQRISPMAAADLLIARFISAIQP